MDAGEGVSLKVWGRFRPEFRPRMTISGTKMMADIFRKFFLLSILETLFAILPFCQFFSLLTTLPCKWVSILLFSLSGA